MAENETALIAPKINLNGTSKEDLLRQCLQAVGALDEALAALREMTPHGRDYQTANSGTFELAAAQHRSRIERVTEVRREVETIAEFIG